ncbi:MAG: DUF600 family protein [Clostridia bacterium]|nr:DUF600 family protein [Clostridia bacterium]
MINETIFQNIFDLLEDHLPDEWQKVALYAAYTAGSFSINFHVMDSSGVYVDCYQCKSISKPKLLKLFMDIHQILEPSRKTADGKQPWTVFTMTVDCEGNVKIHFDYEDIGNASIAYEKKWKEKYLK